MPRLVLVLAGDHVYKMDYGPMLAFHVENNADLTIGCIDVPVSDAVNYGVMTCDAGSRLIEFTEKPASPAEMQNTQGRALFHQSRNYRQGCQYSRLYCDW